MDKHTLRLLIITGALILGLQRIGRMENYGFTFSTPVLSPFLREQLGGEALQSTTSIEKGAVG